MVDCREAPFYPDAPDGGRRALSLQRHTIGPAGARRVIGYYGLAPTAIVPSHLPRSIRTGQPRDSVPCLLLGQLATNLGWIGKGIGAGLVNHVLQRCVAAAGLIGGRALIVNAVDIEAATFWRRRGFIPSKEDPLILFRSMADIAASLG